MAGIVYTKNIPLSFSLGSRELINILQVLFYVWVCSPSKHLIAEKELNRTLFSNISTVFRDNLFLLHIFTTSIINVDYADTEMKVCVVK